jgi:hypothetical protein
MTTSPKTFPVLYHRASIFRAAGGSLKNVTGPVARYSSSVRCYWFSFGVLTSALVAAWIALRFPAVSFAAAVLVFLGIAILGVARLPAIEIRETNLMVGRRAVGWNEIRRVDKTRWIAPLAVNLTLADGRRMLLVHAGGRESSAALLRHLRRYSRQALLDGIPYRQFWGELTPAESHVLPAGPPSGSGAARRVRLLRVEDEEEVERMFQRLKSVGRLDSRDTRGSDEG